MHNAIVFEAIVKQEKTTDSGDLHSEGAAIANPQKAPPNSVIAQITYFIDFIAHLAPYNFLR